MEITRDHLLFSLFNANMLCSNTSQNGAQMGQSAKPLQQAAGRPYRPGGAETLLLFQSDMFATGAGEYPLLTNKKEEQRMLSEAHKSLVYNGLATRFDLPFDQEELDAVEHALAATPQDYHLWCARGILCLGKDPEKTIESLSQALAIRPLSANAVYNRGRAFVSLEQYAQAAADLSLAVDLDPDDPWKWHFLGVARYFIGRFEDALDAFRRSIDAHIREEAPMIPFELDWIWNCYAKLGDEQGLRDCVKNITADIPVDPREITYKHRIMLYAGLLSPEELESMVPVDNHTRMANQMFAVSNYYYYLKHDWGKAVEALNKALSVAERGRSAWGYKMGLLEKEERASKLAAK